MVRFPSKVKQLLLGRELWWRYYTANQATIRPIVVLTITKLLACGLQLLGYATYHCSSPGCVHQSRICFGCKSRYCNTCGKKRTDQWIENLRVTLPDTRWQHITFTMPDVLWPLFKANRHLLNDLSRIAAESVQRYGKKKGVNPGIFTALHTFGRDLKWNTHIHLSATTGGLTADRESWVEIYYPQSGLMKQWRHGVITLLREAWKSGELVLPDSMKKKSHWQAFMREQYDKYWRVHFAKPTTNPLHTIKYLGRYVSRPPLAMKRLQHYNGGDIAFSYRDHRDKCRRTFHCNGFEFLERWTQHIPEKGFRMIRYYGFLSNKTRGKLLPIVYRLLGQQVQLPDVIRYQQLLLSTFGIDPLKCALCGAQMLFAGIHFQRPSLLQYHQSLALNRSLYWRS